ncbi:MAG: hypothetical protein MJZ90_02640 [Bacteroidales bacterium]|nr:hypothetical protein [Bacteroidales bacterium]
MGLFSKLFGKKEPEKQQEFINKDFLEIFEKRKNDPNSCERAPTADDVFVRIESITPRMSMCLDNDICRNISVSRLRGYNMIAIPKDKWDEALTKKQVIDNNNWIIDETARLNNIGIAQEKDNDIDGAISTYETNIKLGGNALHSYDRLIILYHKRGDFENEKRIIKLKINKFGDDDLSLKKRLDKLNGVAPVKIYPQKANVYIKIDITLGKRYEDAVKGLPEFNFYYDIKEDETAISYMSRHSEFCKREDLAIIWDVEKEMKDLVDMATKYENQYMYDKAADVYERIIAEEYINTTPYESLRKIYAASKLMDDEIRVLNRAINHFTKLECRQKEHVLKLATKYNKLSFAQERIDNQQSISYYNGACVLYKHYKKVDDWKLRLEKLQKK